MWVSVSDAGQAEPEQAVVSSDEHEPYLDFDIYYPTAELSVIACAPTCDDG